MVKPMDIKYFYYISNSKVEMLSQQTRRRLLNFPSISPKVEFGGLSLGIDYKAKDAQTEELIEKTVSLVKALSRMKKVRPLSRTLKSFIKMKMSGIMVCILSEIMSLQKITTMLHQRIASPSLRLICCGSSLHKRCISYSVHL